MKSNWKDCRVWENFCTAEEYPGKGQSNQLGVSAIVLQRLHVLGI